MWYNCSSAHKKQLESTYLHSSGKHWTKLPQATQAAGKTREENVVLVLTDLYTVHTHFTSKLLFQGLSSTKYNFQWLVLQRDKLCYPSIKKLQIWDQIYIMYHSVGSPVIYVCKLSLEIILQEWYSNLLQCHFENKKFELPTENLINITFLAQTFWTKLMKL